ncbi:squalene cyclase [Nostoc sp. PCC 7524]|uniref:prenyltransferase/squalene oxidase repeat-containing protein n=1 Tax=Nostoc sp. (strain ATCC 29411 / PCC 7524) TaxID=28072 RepID=UPI00029EF780|nr:prenyltransferase/squalene oxidase repeat-containing protein [Nostoc sp. PCC 7524]AFY50883.1 squalene cyclase [Nostoc sp. PCC 7524]
MDTLFIRQDTSAVTPARNFLREYWPSGIYIETLTNERENICDYFPELFISAFVGITPTQLEYLTSAGQIFASSLVLCDKMMDSLAVAYPEAERILGMQAMQFEAYQLLQQLFLPNASFWSRFRNYYAGYTDACLQEQYFALGKRHWSEYTQALAIEIIKGKTGVAKCTIAGLVELAQNDELLIPLTASIDHFYLANQMLDDLLDWKDDLRCQIPSLLLSRLLKEWPVHGTQQELELLKKQLEREVYYGGHATYLLEMSLQFLEDAEILKADLPNLLWWNITAKLRRKCQALLDDINQIISRNLQRVRAESKFVFTLPPAQSQWQQIAWDGVRFVVKQWQLGFGEARHIMEFAHDQGFSAEKEYQYGDVFQRALIADALCDANISPGQLLQPILDKEVNYLLSRQCTTGVGGWSYFPDLPELPPDADDLAQVMQVFLRAGHQTAVEKYCEAPLDVLLKDCSHDDGSFETWLVPTTNLTPEQERQAEFIKCAWGTGSDTDVIANLFYALTLFDHGRFAENITQGVNYIESQQQPDGSWLSTWYHGPYYGTYVCLRLLAIAKPKSPAIARALNFLHHSQLADGGWGLNDESDALNTALSLLGLAVVQKSGSVASDRTIAQKALTYLQSSQNSDQAWPNCQLIRMELGRATGKVLQVLSYGSSTVTTAFVLKAALLWHQLISNDCA